MSLPLLAFFLLVSVTTPAAAGGRTPPGHSHAFGASLLTWQQSWMQWAFGSSTNALLSDVCGEEVGGVFFLSAAVDLGTKEVECHIPAGTPLLGIPAGGIAWAPTDGQTPEELLVARDGFLEQVSDPQAILDGRPLRLEDAPRLTDVYAIKLEPGNFIQTVDDGVPGDETEVASGGWFVRINPLTPGEHELLLSTVIDGAEVLAITFHITVD